MRLARTLGALEGAEVDYAEIVDPDSLEPRRGEAAPGDVMAVAVFFGAVRLIDNMRLGVP